MHLRLRLDKRSALGLMAFLVVALPCGVWLALGAPGLPLTAAPTSVPTPVAAIVPPTVTPSATTTVTPTPGPKPSRTRKPTKTPTRTPRPPRPITKIGPEICFGTNAPLGRPPVVKLRNVSREYVAEVRQTVGPDCLIVIRFEFDEADLDMDPKQSADEWYARRQADMLAMKAAGGPNIAFETGVNECPEEKLDSYVQFSLELIPRMHADGLRCVAGNPSVGNWNEKSWPRFKPVLDILNPDDFLGVHEYWKDEAQIDDRWYCGRWSIPEIAAVLGNTKIVVTECGREAGWEGVPDPETYLWELEKYDMLLRQYPNVVGATAFTIDRFWPDFDLYDIWPQVVFRYSLTPTPPPTAPGR